jgi:5'-phosphate synthase pdxT subunit
VLIEYENRPVLVRQQHLLAATFHPELTEDTRIHEYFMREIVEPT